MFEKGNGMKRINRRMYMEAQMSPWLSGLCTLSEALEWLTEKLTWGLNRP